MPEISLYTDTSDGDLLLSWILDAGTCLVPDIQYPIPKYVICEDISTIRKFDDQLTGPIFALRDDFTALPLEMHRIDKPDGFFYHIMPRNGGPTLDLSLGRGSQKNRLELIGPGSLSHYPTYWHYVENCNKPAPKPLVALYRKLAYRIRKTFTSYKTEVRTYWIGPGAVARVRRGARLIGFEDQEIDI